MSALIVWITVAVGVGFTLGYLLKPQLRQQIEAPKNLFQKQLQRYDVQLRDQSGSKESKHAAK